MYHRILVPLDGSENAEKVLPWVKAEGLCHGATITVLRVIPPLRSSLMMTPAILEQIKEQTDKITQDYLQGVAARLQAEGLEIKTDKLPGSPAQVILDYAEENQFDLIVIGSRGETGAIRWKFGSVANKVIRTKTSMPVLVINT